MGTNTRLEDVSLTLTSASNVNLTSVYYPDGTTINSKVRTVVINTTSTATGNNSIYGIMANGTSNTTISSFNAVQRATINTISAGSGASRGLMNLGSNYFSVRDATIFCTGAGSNLVGVENSNSSGFTSIKTSTISGTTYDIKRTSGNLLLNATDLQNANSDGNGFSVNTEPSSIFAGTYSKNQAFDNGTQYMMPGTVTHNDLPSSAFPIYFSQNVIIFSGACSCSPALTASKQVIFNFYKNANATPFLSMTLNSSSQYASSSGFSTTITTSDYLTISCNTSGSVPSGTYLLCNASTY